MRNFQKEAYRCIRGIACFMIKGAMVKNKFSDTDNSTKLNMGSAPYNVLMEIQ